MQVQRIRNNDTSFCAKLNVIGTKFDEKTMTKLSDTAKKIGLENDVIELNFYHLFSAFDRHGYYLGQDKCNVNVMFNEFKQKFEAKIFPNGKNIGLEQVSKKLIAKDYHDILQQQEQVANNYLDKFITRK